MKNQLPDYWLVKWEDRPDFVKVPELINKIDKRSGLYDSRIPHSHYGIKDGRGVYHTIWYSPRPGYKLLTFDELFRLYNTAQEISTFKFC